jgi:hypothetical protein
MAACQAIAGRTLPFMAAHVIGGSVKLHENLEEMVDA